MSLLLPCQQDNPRGAAVGTIPPTANIVTGSTRLILVNTSFKKTSLIENKDKREELTNMHGDHSASLEDCRILILEDEYFLSDDLERALKERGATVIGPIPCFAEAKAYAANHDLDAVVMEVRLRGEATYSIADDLARRHVPFVFATGYSADTIPKRFQSVPCWAKPYYVEEVVDHLTMYCCRKKPPATYKHVMAA